VIDGEAVLELDDESDGLAADMDLAFLGLGIDVDELG